MKKKIIIHGINGFIGKNLNKKLKNCKIYDFEKIKNKNIKETFFFIHLAQKAKSKKNTIYPNIKSLVQGLEFCKNKKCSFIFFSSLDANKKNFNNDYLFSKLLSEEICKNYHKNFKFNLVILKISNVYGPEQNINFIIPKILTQLNQDKVKLMNLSGIRDFIYIDDVVSLTQKILNLKKKFLIINVGTGKATSIIELLKILENIIKKKINIINKNIFNKIEVKKSKANINRTKKILKWKPVTNLEKGLKKILLK